MQIRELKIKNFQIHKDITIKFTKGVNVIIGDTGAGKTALVRALNLIICNQPRNAEAIFKNLITKKPLEIQITDDKGNVIKRINRKYYLNENTEPLKAFGTDIPLPIVELFPFKDVNWQRQLDSHFLILQTGGGAAKILNASTGMEDQETLMKEIKSQITEHNHDINRLLKDNQKHQDTINRLKGINRLLMKVKSIEIIINKSDKLQIEINQLNSLINKINECIFDPEIYEKINYLIIKINSIEIIQQQSTILESKINILYKISDQLQEIQKISDKSIICNKLLHSINSIILQSNELLKTEKSINILSTIINELKKTKDKRKYFESELGQIEIEFQEKLLEVGQCPFCGTIFGKENHSC